MPENGHPTESQLYRVVIRMDHKTNAVSFEPHAPDQAFPVFLMQMILAEAQRQLEFRRRLVAILVGKLNYPDIEFKMEVCFDSANKRTWVTGDLPTIEIPVAQMALDEVIRLVNEQRSYINVKMTQQRLAEEATALRLASSLRV